MKLLNQSAQYPYLFITAAKLFFDGNPHRMDTPADVEISVCHTFTVFVRLLGLPLPNKRSGRLFAIMNYAKKRLIDFLLLFYFAF